ncbi:DUF3592 domain-containing protein [Amycolatopsis pigmentata]|uniref:DUF3592 domain-containing protein n=1 Tax=Amycolatopsis pigmentata TaxID=450801 RepID=UPI00366CD4F9
MVERRRVPIAVGTVVGGLETAVRTLVGLLLITIGAVMLSFGFDSRFALWITGFVPLFGGFVLLVLGGMVADARQRSRLMATGLAGTGTVITFRDTGMTVNDNPRVEFDLRVTPADGSPDFRATTRKTVSRLELPYAGQELSVRYDPDDRTKIVIAGPAEPAERPVTEPETTGTLEDLNRLFRLKQSGAITEDEYQTLKKRIGFDEPGPLKP